MLGVSMGGVTALNEVDDDLRIDAVVIESTHATMANATQARLERAGYPLSLPGSWAILLGTLIRTGEDVSSADAVQAIARLDDRPVLIISGGMDDLDRRARCRRPARGGRRGRLAGELHVCEEAGHAKSLEVVPGGLSGLGARLPRARPGARRADARPPPSQTPIASPPAPADAASAR